MAELFLYAVSGARLRTNHNTIWTERKEPRIWRIPQILFGDVYRQGMEEILEDSNQKSAESAKSAILFLFCCAIIAFF